MDDESEIVDLKKGIVPFSVCAFVHPDCALSEQFTV